MALSGKGWYVLQSQIAYLQGHTLSKYVHGHSGLSNTEDKEGQPEITLDMAGTHRYPSIIESVVLMCEVMFKQKH